MKIVKKYSTENCYFYIVGLGKGELLCLLLFICYYVVYVWRDFLFLLVLGMGYVILLWHSLSRPYYNYFTAVKNRGILHGRVFVMNFDFVLPETTEATHGVSSCQCPFAHNKTPLLEDGW